MTPSFESSFSSDKLLPSASSLPLTTVVASEEEEAIQISVAGRRGELGVDGGRGGGEEEEAEVEARVDGGGKKKSMRRRGTRATLIEKTEAGWNFWKLFDMSV